MERLRTEQNCLAKGKILPRQCGKGFLLLRDSAMQRIFFVLCDAFILRRVGNGAKGL